MPTRLRVLMVDDMMANRLLVGRFLERLGHEVIEATNGHEAIERFAATRPDLVLMDIMMPGMDGREASREIRRLSGEAWVPIIFLSALTGERDQIAGLDVGDDYLPKPLNLALLGARIKVMTRIKDMQRRLEIYRAENEGEQHLARHVLERIIGYRERTRGAVKNWIKPAANLSGDIAVFARSPTGALHLMLADATGHGLAAAIATVPANDAFRSMTRRGFGIGAIARDINARLHRLLPTGQFLSAALVRVDGFRQLIEVWNGGIPAVLFSDRDGKVVRDWRSAHPPLGILDDAGFDARVDTYHRDGPGELFVCSDGVIEAENRDGAVFGRAGLEAALAAGSGGSRFDSIIAAIGRHLDGADNRDDFSLAAVDCGGDIADADFLDAFEVPEATPFQASGWSLTVEFSTADLRDLDPMPILVGWLNQIGLPARPFREVLLVMTELFNNALDHGVLGLDSTLKQAPDGFAAYFRQRDERLRTLAAGRIEVELKSTREAGLPVLRLRLRDSGKGFDHAARLAAPDPARFHGRGLALVASLCRNLRFSAGGAEVSVDYPLERDPV